MHTTRHSPFECPTCSTRIDSTSNLTRERQPYEGAVALCVYCGQMLIFGKGMVLRAATDADLDRLPKGLRTTLENARAALRQAKSIIAN